MKKVFYVGWAFLMAMMCSCTKTEVVNNSNWQIVDCNVGYSQWRYTGDNAGQLQYANNYYYAAYDISQLTSFIFNSGNVQAYLIEKNSYGEETQRPLPFTRHKEEWNEQGDKFTYTETYDYFYGVGWIEFNYTASDFEYEKSGGIQYRPTDKQFRVVMTW